MPLTIFPKLPTNRAHSNLISTTMMTYQLKWFIINHIKLQPFKMNYRTYNSKEHLLYIALPFLNRRKNSFHCLSFGYGQLLVNYQSLSSVRKMICGEQKTVSHHPLFDFLIKKEVMGDGFLCISSPSVKLELMLWRSSRPSQWLGAFNDHWLCRRKVQKASQRRQRIRCLWQEGIHKRSENHVHTENQDNLS